MSDQRAMLKKIQRQAATVTDELMQIAEDIEELIQSYHADAGSSILKLSARYQNNRCGRLMDKIKELQQELAEGQTENKTECTITESLLGPDLAILLQNRQLLESLENHAERIEKNQELIRQMKGKENLERLKRELAEGGKS